MSIEINPPQVPQDDSGYIRGHWRTEAFKDVLAAPSADMEKQAKVAVPRQSDGIINTLRAAWNYNLPSVPPFDKQFMSEEEEQEIEGLHPQEEMLVAGMEFGVLHSPPPPSHQEKPVQASGDGAELIREHAGKELPAQVTPQQRAQMGAEIDLLTSDPHTAFTLLGFEDALRHLQ